jgi:hypothetical protein
MKLDPDIPIVQNEAAIMTTMAAELFLKSLAKESHRIAKARGRNTIRYVEHLTGSVSILLPRIRLTLISS